MSWIACILSTCWAKLYRFLSFNYLFIFLPSLSPPLFFIFFLFVLPSHPYILSSLSFPSSHSSPSFPCFPFLPSSPLPSFPSSPLLPLLSFLPVLIFILFGGYIGASRPKPREDASVRGCRWLAKGDHGDGAGRRHFGRIPWPHHQGGGRKGSQWCGGPGEGTPLFSLHNSKGTPLIRLCDSEGTPLIGLHDI